MKNILIVDIPTGPVFPTDLFTDYNARIQNYRSKSQDIFFRQVGIVSCPAQSYTRGLLVIASILEQCGAKIFYINSDANPEYLQECLHIIDTIDYVLVSTKTNTYPIILDLLLKIKTKKPSVISILGGPHVTALPEDCLSDASVDVVVRGEGDNTIKDLYLTLSRGSDLKDVKGIAYKNQKTDIVITEDRQRLNSIEISSLPLPAYHLLPGGINNYYVYLETTRGCTYNCAFCSGPKYWRHCGTTRSVAHFMSELDYLEKYINKYNLLHISDPMLGITTDQKKIIQALQKRKNMFHFSCDIKANYVTPDLIQEMTKASVNIFSIGIETTNDKSLKVIRKNITASEEIEACKKIKHIKDSFIKSYWITGLPGETAGTLLKQNQLMYNLLKDGTIDQVCSHILVPYPGTDLFQTPEKFSLKILHQDWIHYEGRSYPPVYRLESLTEHEIYNYFLQSLVLELKYYQEIFRDQRSPSSLSMKSGIMAGGIKEVPFSKVKGRLL